MVRKSLKKQNYKRKYGGGNGKFSKKNYKSSHKNNLQNKANQEFIKSLQKTLIQGGADYIGTAKNYFGNTHTEWRVIELTSAPSEINENDKKPSFGGERKKVKQITAKILDEKAGQSDNFTYKKQPNGWPEYDKPDVSGFNNNNNNNIIKQTEFINNHLKEVNENSAEYNTNLDSYYAAKDKFDKAQQAVKSYLSFNLNSTRNLFKSGETAEKFKNEKDLSDKQKNQALDRDMPTENQQPSTNPQKSSPKKIEITDKLRELITAIKTAKEEMDTARKAVNDTANKTKKFKTYIIASFYCDNITRVIKPNGLITFEMEGTKSAEVANAVYGATK